MKKLFVAAFVAFAGFTTLETKASIANHQVVNSIQFRSVWPAHCNRH